MTAKKRRVLLARPCPRCEGTGTLQLHGALAAVAEVLADRPLTLRDVCDATGSGRNTTNARLQRLVTLGLVSRTLDDGGAYVYGLRV